VPSREQVALPGHSPPREPQGMMPPLVEEEEGGLTRQSNHGIGLDIQCSPSQVQWAMQGAFNRAGTLWQSEEHVEEAYPSLWLVAP
jgi:hypothetical protein